MKRLHRHLYDVISSASTHKSRIRRRWKYARRRHNFFAKNRWGKNWFIFQNSREFIWIKRWVVLNGITFTEIWPFLTDYVSVLGRSPLQINLPLRNYRKTRINGSDYSFFSSIVVFKAVKSKTWTAPGNHGLTRKIDFPMINNFFLMNMKHFKCDPMQLS